MFVQYFIRVVVVLAVVGSEFEQIFVEAGDSSTCRNLKQSAQTIIRQSKPYTAACKCGTVISKVELVNASTGKTESRTTCVGCTTTHIPIKQAAYCTEAKAPIPCICKESCSGLNVYACSCAAAITTPKVDVTTIIPPLELPY